MRKLASVQKIAEIAPIAGADKICKYRINGWWVIDGVDKYSIGDKVVYCEPDSFLPIKPEFEFLRKSCYKKLSDGKEGFRLRAIKLKNTVSSGLIIPLDSVFNIIEIDQEKYISGVYNCELKQLNLGDISNDNLQNNKSNQ